MPDRNPGWLRAVVPGRRDTPDRLMGGTVPRHGAWATRPTTSARNPAHDGLGFLCGSGFGVLYGLTTNHDAGREAMPRKLAPAPADPLRGRSYLEAHFGISPSTRRRWFQAGLIPVPDRVVNARPFWFESTIRRIGRPAASDQAQRDPPAAPSATVCED